MNSVSIPQGCPWHGLYKTFGPPNINWCEEILCAYINNPANTWSNIGYILIGVWILKTWSRDAQFQKLYALTLIFTGVVSALYHATNNYLTQFFDFVGMFTLVSAIIVFNVKRLRWTKKLSMWLFSFLTLIFSLGFFWAHYLFPVQFLIVIAIGIILIQEGILLRQKKAKSFSLFALAMIFLGIAQGFSQLDLHRIWCNPSHHIILQGHALWHLIGSIALGVYFLYLRKNMSE